MTKLKHDDTISVRVPHELRDALELKRQRMSKSVKAEVKTSAVIRAILELHLRPKKRSIDDSERVA